MKPIPARSLEPRRFGVLALALLQFGMFAAFPVADAVLEARGLAADIHIENEGSEHCDTGHSHLLCQLTRSLSSGIPAPLSIDFRLALEASLRTPAAAARENRPILLGGSGPRAPPAVLPSGLPGPFRIA